MSRLPHRGFIIGLLLTVCSLLLALASCNQDEPADGQGSETAEVAVSEHMSHYEFSPQEASNIIGNSMHEVHNESNGIDCCECHEGEEWITHQEALDLCIECHEERIVAADIWHNHCISCHQFTKYAEAYAGSTHILRELCQDCHGLESVIYTAFDPESPHDITCDNCHHPHETSLVYSGELCETCHEDITGVVSPENRVHGSCLVCHTPHKAIHNSSELCSECHYASADILVHNVPDHPTDCLACHHAHFSHTEIGDHACQKCHDDTYYGGESHLPDPHKDCANCHIPSNFVYKGDQVCVGCHAEEESVLNATGLPDEHRHCTTCHDPHHWYARYESNCERCHDVQAVIEHNLSFHQHECAGCHNPHSIQTMAKSGDCQGCHTDLEYLHFKPDTPVEHLACENCHSKVAIDSRRFSFTGPANSCMLCHPAANTEGSLDWDNVPFGHRVCNVCHEPHTFEITQQSKSCNLCHVDIYDSKPNIAHALCTNCHGAGHLAGFVGYEDSCLACHGELPGLHAGHSPQVNELFACSTCHAEHGFTADTESCQACHSDLPESCGENCLDCHGFAGE